MPGKLPGTEFLKGWGMTKNRILVVDDNKNVLEGLNLLLGEKYDTFLAFDGESALEIIRSKDIDLVITDMVMPGISGLELLEKIKALKPDITVVILTGHGTIELAVEAIKKGAADLIEKPFQVDKILVDVENLMRMRQLERKNRVLQRKLVLEEKKLQFVAENDNMKKVMKRVKALRKNDANVLIAGESGVGKELLARIVHKYSSRREYPFVKVNCGLITAATFHEILCGREGETLEKPGLFAIAEGGTIFFDHIEKMDTKSQSMLAEILRNGKYPLPSGNVYSRLSARVISSSRDTISELVDRKKFNEELFYLVNIMDFVLPPLRKRRDDIMPIAEYFLERFSKDTNKRFKGYTIEVANIFNRYDWPGNVRELENVVERAVFSANRINVGAKFLPVGMKFNKRSPEIVLKLFTEKMEEAEEALIRHTLDKYRGNIMKASKAMGITRATLYNKIKRYKLDK